MPVSRTLVPAAGLTLRLFVSRELLVEPPEFHPDIVGN
jgi:hypothetical protein